jgi:hypothetical protein
VNQSSLKRFGIFISDNITMTVMCIVWLLVSQSLPHVHFRARCTPLLTWPSLPPTKRLLRKFALGGVAAAAAFVLWGLFWAWFFYINTDYPCFLWIRDDATECGTKNLPLSD